MANTPEPLDFDKPLTVLRYVDRNTAWPMREKKAYGSLYLRRSEDSRCPFPGLRKLASDMGTTKDAAMAAVHRLAEIGAVTIDLRAGDSGQNVYTLSPPWAVPSAIPKPPRGVHAVPETGTSLSPKQGRVPKTGTGGVPKTGTAVSLKQGQKEPIKEPIQGANKKNSARQAERDSDPAINEATQAVVDCYDRLLKDAGMSGVANWGAARKTVEGILKGARGAPPISRDDAVAAIRWAWQDDYHRQKLMAIGMVYLRSAWAAWMERDKRRAASDRKPSNVFLKRERHDDSYYDYIANKFSGEGGSGDGPGAS